MANSVTHDDTETQEPDPDCVIVGVGKPQTLSIDPALDVEAQLKTNFERCIFKDSNPRLVIFRQVHARELCKGATTIDGGHIWKPIQVDLKSSKEFLDLNRSVSQAMSEK